MSLETPPTSKNDTLGDLLRHAREGQETIFDIARTTDDDGKPETKIVVERRKLQPEVKDAPERAENKRRAHVFSAPTGFIAYLRRYGGEDTVVFCDPNEGRVQASLDEEADGGREVVSMVPQIHPRWEPWRELLGARTPIMRFGDFVREQARTIVDPDPRALALEFGQIRLSTNVQLFQGKPSSGQPSLNGIMIRTEIHGSGDTDSDFRPMTETIKVKSPVWVDGPEEEIEIDVIFGAKPDGTEVWVSLASADIRDAEVVAFDNMVAKLREELTNMTVTHGAFGEKPWDYIA